MAPRLMEASVVTETAWGKMYLGVRKTEERDRRSQMNSINTVLLNTGNGLLCGSTGCV